MSEHLKRQYARLKKIAPKELGGSAVADLIREMVLHARNMLAGYELIHFTSLVPDKRYIGYRATTESRPINTDLYIQEAGEFTRLIEAFLHGMPEASAYEITKITYSIALSIFAAHDVNQVGRKASATFFEILIGHIVARLLDVAPRKKVRMPESEAELPTDYVFELGAGRRKVHLPIKTSTRERAVQAWVHQLVLDRIFGNGVYTGIFVVCGETKRDSRTGEIIEICVPQQLQMFQSRVAQLSRVYYLDPPKAYMELAKKFPRVEVRSFGEAFRDLRGLLET
ncbi:MAG: hypothetical protein WD733_12380 [Bryobacterales bacterium]